MQGKANQVCRCCLERESQKYDDFFWVKKYILDDFKDQHAETESPNNNDEQTMPLLNLIAYVQENYKTEVRREELHLARVHSRGKQKSATFEVWRIRHGEVIAMKTNGDIVLDQKMGGYLLDLSGDVPDFDKFYVSRCDGSSDNPEDKLLVLSD